MNVLPQIVPAHLRPPSSTLLPRAARLRAPSLPARQPPCPSGSARHGFAVCRASHDDYGNSSIPTGWGSGSIDRTPRLRPSGHSSLPRRDPRSIQGGVRQSFRRRQGAVCARRRQRSACAAAELNHTDPGRPSRRELWTAGHRNRYQLGATAALDQLELLCLLCSLFRWLPGAVPARSAPPPLRADPEPPRLPRAWRHQHFQLAAFR